MTSPSIHAVPAGKLRVREEADLVQLEASSQFVASAPVQGLADRALAYLKAGYAVHFAGPAGTGKTTLAFHVATLMARPVTLIHGDDEFGSSDLIGNDNGYRRSRLVDNFIHSVIKTHEEMEKTWVDNRLTTACKNGHTLIYDEFTRSRPEANNVLLSILEERILDLPRLGSFGQAYLNVHPGFRAIFTSNPEEYVGTHKAQDALADRLITIRVGHYDRETEVGITMARSGVSREDAEVIVDIVRELRGRQRNSHRPSIRACLALARVLAGQGAHAVPSDSLFRWACEDILGMETAKVTKEGRPVASTRVMQVVEKVCYAQGKRAAPCATKACGESTGSNS